MPFDAGPSGGFDAGDVNRSGPGRALVGRPKVGAIRAFDLGSALMEAASDALVGSVERVLAPKPAVEVRFGAGPKRSAAKNAVIGFAHALQPKSAEFLETARRAARVERGADPDEVGARTVPTRNAYYTTRVEKRTIAHTARDGLLEAARADRPELFADALFKGADGQRANYGQHILDGELLTTHARFIAEGEPGGVPSLSAEYAARKERDGYGGKPILVATEELINCLVTVRTNG